MEVKTYNKYYKKDKTINGVPYTKQGEYAFKEKANIVKASDWSKSKTKIIKERDKYVLYIHHKGIDKYDIEQEKKELAKDGWTMEEVMGLAGFVKKRVANGINEYKIK